MKTLLVTVLLSIVCCASAATRPLIVVAESYAPSSFMIDGQVSGFDVDIAKAVFDKLGVPIQVQLVPWARAFAMLKSGQADVGLHVSHAEDRAPYLLWPQTAVWNADFVFMATQRTKARYELRSFDDTKRFGLAIGIIQNNAYAPVFWQAYPSPNRANQEYNKQLDPASDAVTNLIKLAAGRIQLFPFPRILADYMTREMKLDTVTYYDWVIFSKPYPNAFSRASTFSSATYPDIRALMKAYDEELARMKNDRAQYHAFFARYRVEE